MVSQQRSVQKYPLDPVSCPMYCFTADQVDSHFKTIHEGMPKLNASKIRDICLPILDDILKEKYAFTIFGQPVDPVALGLTDYYEIVKLPMDLGTIRKKLDLNSYRDLDTFRFDINLVFDNALLYNPEESDVHSLAKNLKKQFEGTYRKAINIIEKRFENDRLNPDKMWRAENPQKSLVLPHQR